MPSIDGDRYDKILSKVSLLNDNDLDSELAFKKLVVNERVMQNFDPE